jgi:GR25 family glycosyltransferase involved in LPS biosynthesis
MDNSTEFTFPVDVFVRHYWLHKMTLYGLIPYAADGGAHSIDSNIGKRHKVKRSPLVVAQRILYKLYARVMTNVENVRYWLENRG